MKKGEKFWRLTAIRRAERKEFKGRYRCQWLFVCECGTEKIIRADQVISGNTMSCGCYWREINHTHGMSGTRFFKIWRGMQERCYNPNIKAYKWYGEKGVTIEWRTFEEFRDHMYESYLKHAEEFGERNTELDRTDSNKNYCKENCRWATQKEQGLNKSSTKFITFRGKTQCISDWASEFGITPSGLGKILRNYNGNMNFAAWRARHPRRRVIHR